MSYHYTHRTIIVPTEFQQLAQALCAAAAEGDAGKGMFTTGCVPVAGDGPTSCYISSGLIYESLADLLPLTTFDEDGQPTTRPGNVEAVEAIADQAGIALPAGTIAALFAAIDVSEQEPFTALARLGLMLATDEGAAQ
jgi:hypothetical protein